MSSYCEKCYFSECDIRDSELFYFGTFWTDRSFTKKMQKRIDKIPRAVMMKKYV